LLLYTRLPLILASLALAISLTGITPADAARAVKRALTADNADKVNGIRAAKKPTAGRLVPLGANARFPASVIPSLGARGPRGPQGPPGPLGGAGGDLVGTYPNPTVRPGAVSADEIANPYMFRAHNLSVQDTPAGDSRRVVLGGEDLDPSGGYDPTASEYTIPISGYWQLSASVGTCCAGGRMFAEIASSRSTARIRGTDVTSNGILQSVASGLVYLQRGDTVWLAIYTGAVNQVYETDALTYLSGFLVSAG